MAVLTAEGIRKSYWHRGPRYAVLSGVSLAVEPGSVLCILGPSGCGKSTLLRILAGLEEADGGTLRLAGQPLRAGHPDLAIMFQDPCLLPWLTVRENLRFGIRFLGRGGAEEQQEVDAALELVGLTDFAHWRPAQLSGGMAQRVALARALVRNPRLLLLDEPLSALDANTRRQLQDDLRRIVAARGMAAVLVTHDVDEALYLADRLVVLNARPARVVLDRPNPLPAPRDTRAPGLEWLRAELMAALAAVPAEPGLPQYAL